MRVDHRIDADRLPENAIGDRKRKASHQSPAHAELEVHPGIRMSRLRQSGDAVKDALDGRVEALPATFMVVFVALRGLVELGASCRIELDLSHDRFSRARPSSSTCCSGTPGAFAEIRRSISAA